LYPDAASLLAGFVLPALVVNYVRKTFSVWRLRPEFSLYKYETSELNRAVQLLRTILHRLETMPVPEKTMGRFWRVFRGRATVNEDAACERENLEMHARQLRSIIVDIRRRPLLRLSAATNIKSSQFALGRAICVHVASFALLGSLGIDNFAHATGPMEMSATGQLAYENAIAAALALLTMPFFYFLRRSHLHSQHDLEFCIFKDLALLDPESISDDQFNATENAQPSLHSDVASQEQHWRDVLGVSHETTIDEVKTAYKVLVKQNHPDRVSGMADAFHRLAELQTKKINVAYREALTDLAGRG
jgi:DnaJ-domain-containing protein 1